MTSQRMPHLLDAKSQLVSTIKIPFMYSYDVIGTLKIGNFSLLLQRLAELANALLKLASSDQETMSSEGLRRYVTDVMPNVDWTQEQV